MLITWKRQGFGRALLCALMAIWGSSTGCSDLSKGTRAHIGVHVGDDGLEVLEYELSSITAGSGQRDIVKIQIKNSGDADLQIHSIALLSKNLDDTDVNPWVEIDWGSFDPQLGFPHTIHPFDSLTVLAVSVIYEPGACDQGVDCKFSNAATLEIKSSDEDKPTMHIKLQPPSCQPEPRVEPPKDTFFNATSAKPETKTFQITNIGNCDTTVTKIDLSAPTTKFSVIQSFPDGQLLKHQYQQDYEPLIFQVKYTPTATSDNDQVTVRVYTSDRPGSPIEVPLSTKLEKGSFIVSYCTTELGYIDFKDVGSQCETCIVNVINEGPASMTIKGIAVPEDEEETHYKLSAELVGNPPQTIQNPKTQAIGLVEGRSVDIEVEYCGSLEGLNATLEINYTNPEHGIIEIPMFGGKEKSCFDIAPGHAAKPLVMQFHGAASAEITRDFVLYNCGNAPLTIHEFRFQNAFEQPTEYWSMMDPPAGDLTIGAGGLQVLTVKMIVTDGEIEPSGVMYIDYTDHLGTKIENYGVTLQGVIGSTATPPTAVAESSGDAVVATQHELIGINSQPGSEGIAENGYVWYLVAKPAGSQVIVNGGADDPNVKWIPDLPGTYTFELLVHGNSGDFLYSAPASVSVTATAP